MPARARICQGDWQRIPMLLLVAGLLWLATTACVALGTDVPAEESDSSTASEIASENAPITKKAVVVSLTGKVIVPRYEAAAFEMEQLKAATESLCRAPSATTLEDARRGWRQARQSWKETEAMRFGPVMQRKSLGLVDWPTAEPEEIERLLARRDSLTLYDVQELVPSDLRGLGAMEYLLFGQDDAVRSALAAPGSLRCDYLVALSQAAAAEVAAVQAEWVSGSPGQVPYRDVFNGTAASSLHESAALSDMVGSIVFLNRKLGEMQLAPALGFDGESPDPAAIPGGPAHHAVADLRRQILGMQALYLGAGNGQEGLGLSHLVSQLSPEIDQQTAAALATALIAIEELEEPLQQTILSDPAPSRETFDRITDLQRIFNADIASLLNITVGFSDQDGDS